MAEAAPCSSTSTTATKKQSKKPKQFDRNLKLPTPPPDPWNDNIAKTNLQDEIKTKERSSSNVSEKDREMFEYIESLHKSAYSKTASGLVPALITEEAFDHLEKLYKLMEQMLELREQNVKLHRRIRDLEHLNNLEKFAINPDNVDEEYPDLEKDTAFAEAILESILQDPKNKELPKYKNLRNSLLRRPRSESATDKPAGLEMPEKEEKDVGSLKPDKQSKVSKWTKVKAAFKWEKASNVGEIKSQDSGIHVPINYEIARYLRVPSTGDEMGHSPGDSGAGISTPGTISSASSNDDLRMGRQQCDDFRSSDDEISHHYISHGKEYRQKSPKYQHRTPWAKMKEIIHPRNSLRKKHRLSAASDDIQIDVEFCSDNEDVFETDDPGIKSANLSLSPSPYNAYSNSSVSPCGSDIPLEIVERYQKVAADDSTSESETRSSKWIRVRKAFLNRDYQPNQIVTKHTEKPEDSNVEEEIQRNYKNLQKKLSLEFQEKINEWERLKQNSPSTGSGSATACSFLDENHDQFYIKKMEELQKIKSHSPTNQPNRNMAQISRENELQPDFKKKLQEWERIKKSSGGRRSKKLGEIKNWKSLSGPRSSDHSPVFEYPALTDEFRKKLEEWRQIKASGGPLHYTEQKKLKDKTPSPKLSRKNSSPKESKKSKDSQNKELHWFEKELGKIEKEKQRLERERQKFIEREERLSKLRRSVLGVPQKKEILIHTPSGFHRFEGISRKFTQKLYEWEKSQGIAPEASTFALLSASGVAAEPTAVKISSRNNLNKEKSLGSLPRSKSADSIAISALNLTCPLLSGHPSSLSLNDMDNLEKECLADSKPSSFSCENDYLDIDEPEAVLVEVEDYEEETTEPLHISCTEKHQLPVYQRQECEQLCESETIVVPKIRRSESTRAQINYDLIESIVKLLTELQVTEDEIRCLSENKSLMEEQNRKTFKFLNELQKQSIRKLSEKLSRLKEANQMVVKNLARDSNLNDIWENVQDISVNLLEKTDEMSKTVSNRLLESNFDIHNTLFDSVKHIRSKIGELRRHLSYICAATDLKTPIRKKSGKFQATKSLSSDDAKHGSDKERKFIKMEGATNISASQGAVKKRIRHRQKILNKLNIVDSDDDGDENGEQKSVQNRAEPVRQHRKLTRMRSLSEGGETALIFDPKLLAPTPDIKFDSSPADSAVTLFVKTTRKLFTPIAETSLGKSSTEPNICLKLQDTNQIEKTWLKNDEEPTGKSEVANPKVTALAALPPLPSSPVPQRKVYKDVSPSIKLIMAKYNQNLEQSAGIKSGGSSGSNSPIVWRSPLAERRVRVQTEKYLEEVNKLSPLLGRQPVQKSSSASAISCSTKQVTIPRKASLSLAEQRKPNLSLDIESANAKFSPEIRRRKLQKAKEEFLKMPISAPAFTSEHVLQYPERNRLSQMSVESDDNNQLPWALIKSASAGMINIEAEVFNRINPEYRPEGYVSLPRQTKSPKTATKSAFSTIASKFRKVKMRRGKDRDKQAVATLCRQSLLVDINLNDNNNLSLSGESYVNNNGELHGGERRESGSNSISSTISKSNSWIRRSLFKK